jgi:sugar O-acyltransferase (sialic acid O-acetyltransferase NeuD family)
MKSYSSGDARLVIVGAGGHAISVANVAFSAGYSRIFFIDVAKRGSSLLGCPILGDISNLSALNECHFAIGVGDNAVRHRLANDLKLKYPDFVFPILIHPTGVVCTGASLGRGTVVMPGAVVGPQSEVGEFCLINTRASLDHDCRMQDFASLAPGAVTGGRVEIGLRSAISIGATVKHGITVGSDAVLGAASYLNKNLPCRVIAYGIPATVVRSRALGDPYLN